MKLCIEFTYFRWCKTCYINMWVLTFSVLCKELLIIRLLSLSCRANPTISSVKSSWSFLWQEKFRKDLEPHKITPINANWYCWTWLFAIDAIKRIWFNLIFLSFFFFLKSNFYSMVLKTGPFKEPLKREV